MNLQDERIQVACDTLALGAVADNYPALAQQAVDSDASYIDFLEHCLKAEQDERKRSRGRFDRLVDRVFHQAVEAVHALHAVVDGMEAP